MKWIIVAKNAAAQPKHGTYRDWKHQVAKECSYLCVYCAITEGAFGGTRNFHVEHYRPRRGFPELSDDILNLFYACAICNCFKSDDWPRDPCLEVPSYPDPSTVDYNGLFEMDSTYMLVGKHVASRYVVERLHLNRAQLVVQRRVAAALERADKLAAFFRRFAPELNARDKDLGTQLIENLCELIQMRHALDVTRPYTSEDTR